MLSKVSMCAEMSWRHLRGPIARQKRSAVDCEGQQLRGFRNGELRPIRSAQVLILAEHHHDADAPVLFVALGSEAAGQQLYLIGNRRQSIPTHPRFLSVFRVVAPMKSISSSSASLLTAKLITDSFLNCLEAQRPTRSFLTSTRRLAVASVDGNGQLSHYKEEVRPWHPS